MTSMEWFFEGARAAGEAGYEARAACLERQARAELVRALVERGAEAPLRERYVPQEARLRAMAAADAAYLRAIR